jgi:predicted methyltransferase
MRPRPLLCHRLLALSATVACATQRTAPLSATSPADEALAKEVVSAPDRLDRDREPAQMLVFFGVEPGTRVGEVGAGGGYSTELFARATGPSGAVYAQDTPDWDGPGLTQIWEMRLARPVLQNTRHFVRQWEEPFPADVKDLDAVYSVAVYHDVLAEKHDTARMNQAIFAALKPGGFYAIIDNSARAGTGAADVERYHRIDEQLVRDEVQRAGFRLLEQASFLRNPQDPRDWNADSGVNKLHTQDRFALKFIKP